jgi:hypothetical protein
MVEWAEVGLGWSDCFIGKGCWTALFSLESPGPLWRKNARLKKKKKKFFYKAIPGPL